MITILGVPTLLAKLAG